MSRVTSLAGLFLIGNHKKAVFKVNNAAVNKYERLRAQQALSSLIQTNILCFTETQLLPSQGDLDLPAMMRGFYVTYNSSGDRFSSLASVIVIT